MAKSSSESGVPSYANMRPLTIVAQDPSVHVNGHVLVTQVDIPAEKLANGPWGARVHVIDYDASAKSLYRPWQSKRKGYIDPFEELARSDPDKLLELPHFHAQNVYAIVMRILARFEFALGRRVGWGFKTHQLKVVPHAFAIPNAFYSRSDQSLFFGYFPGSANSIYSCLSHDVVAHETTHALLDGLRERYLDPSSPDQAAFHEGFSDVVALLSVFSMPEVVDAALTLNGTSQQKIRNGRHLVAVTALTPSRMAKSVLLGLAEQMGEELSLVRGRPLRQSATLRPDPDYPDPMKHPEFEEPHRRGELLVASMMRAFLAVFHTRVQVLDAGGAGWLDRELVIEEARKAAEHLLTMSIRALDYCMPVHVTFGDFLSGLLTADRELCPNDSKFSYRTTLVESFSAYGIQPAYKGSLETGTWIPANSGFNYERTHFRWMQTDPDEVFRFLWENRQLLKLRDDVYTRVLSVRPSLRVGPDGFFLQETIAEYLQVINVRASELKLFKVRMPNGMSDNAMVRLHGGGTLVFDQYSRLKYHIHNRIDRGRRQTERVKYLWQNGYFRDPKRPMAPRSASFANLHRLRSLNARTCYREEWL